MTPDSTTCAYRFDPRCLACDGTEIETQPAGTAAITRVQTALNHLTVIQLSDGAVSHEDWQLTASEAEFSEGN